MDDHILRSQTMHASPYVMPLEPILHAWEERLVTIQDTMDVWLKVQNTWLYLEPIFSSEDIQRQMPSDAAKFSQGEGTPGRPLTDDDKSIGPSDSGQDLALADVERDGRVARPDRRRPSGPARRPAPDLLDAGGHPEGPARLSGAQARLLLALLLPVQRRTARDPV